MPLLLALFTSPSCDGVMHALVERRSSEHCEKQLSRCLFLLACIHFLSRSKAMYAIGTCCVLTNATAQLSKHKSAILLDNTGQLSFWDLSFRHKVLLTKEFKQVDCGRGLSVLEDTGTFWVLGAHHAKYRWRSSEWMDTCRPAHKGEQGGV